MGLVVLLGSLSVVLCGFLPWAVVANPGAADGTVTGWGGIGGDGSAAGENINDIITDLGGSGSYRPALPAAALAALVLAAGIWVLVRRSRIAAAAAAGGAILIAGWALFRAVVPGDVAGIVEEGGATSGIGPWFTAVAALLLAGVAAFGAARIPTMPIRLPPPRRGIGARR